MNTQRAAGEPEDDGAQAPGTDAGATAAANPGAEDALAACMRQVANLRALVDAGIQISAELSLDRALQRIVDVGRGVLRARYAALGVVGHEAARLERFLFSGMSEEEARQIGSPPVGKGILGALLREARPLRLKDLTQDPRSVGFPPHHPPMHSFLGVPIIARGRVFGRLYFAEKEGADEFTEEDEQLALALAAQAAVAIENASLFQEVQEQQDQLMRAQRLRDIGALAATIGHELRNPLSTIQNAAFLLDARVPKDDPRVARNLEIIRQEVQRATRIIEDLLEFSRVRPPQPVPVDAAALVQEALSRQELPANILVENAITPGGPKVCVDPVQMEQVLGNLISNAVEAMPDGGTLRLQATQRNGHTLIQVSDTGVGIPPENLTRIFEPLFTTKTRGVGLGLALVRRVVEAHAGNVHVESSVGQGTTITIELPTCQ